jgi:hypothetical protein
MAKEIKLSPKYGVNPTVVHCFICGTECGVAILGKLKGDKEAPMDSTHPSILCDRCQAEIDAGNHFILEAIDSPSDTPLRRTGRYVCLKHGSIPEITHPVNYMDSKMFSQLFNKFLNNGENKQQEE